MHHITEDTPPDMLAGAMDLCVRLPDGRDVNMAVERSTPMMDLLVQVTTAYKLRPSDHIVQALDMSEQERALPYKPNTPIGALDTQRIRVIPKDRPPAPRAPPPPGHQPFESTFRLQVHLPRNQFCVIRVGKFVMLEDIMRKVCEEKNLDPRKYEFRHPANIDKVLDPKRTLNDYEITEITVVHRGSATHLSQTISSSDIMGLQREEERRKLQAKTGGGVLNLIFRRGRTSMGSGSVSSDTRSISPTQSDDSRSVTPPAVQPPILPPVPQEVKQPPNRPKPPQRKRRPAPKPPSQPSPAAEIDPPVPEPEKCQQEVTAKLENGLTICHSRNSSDSSGYHEASILSDNCTTLPRRPKSTVINTSLTNSTLSIDQGMEVSKSTGNLSNMTTQSVSTMSLANAGRKKKAPPPPPVLKSASSVANINSVSSSVPVVASSNESTPKIQSDNSSPAMNNDSMPKPKPRTIITPVPVPTPRRIFTSSSDETLSLPVTINFNQTPTNQEQSIPNSLVNTDDSDNILTNSSTESELSENNLLKSRKQNGNSSDSELSIRNVVSTDRKDSKFARERGFQIGKSMLTMDAEDVNPSTQELTDTSSVKTLNSSSSSQNIFEEHFTNLEIENVDMFKSKPKQKIKKYSRSQKTHAFAEIHDFQQNKTYDEVLPHSTTDELHNNESMLSLRSVKSIPAFMDSDTNIKKWGNVQNLDEDDCSLGSSHHWVVGDSDAESTCPATPSDLTSLPRTSDTSINTASLASFSQDSSNIQPTSRSSLTTSDIPVSEDSTNSHPAFTSTPTRSQSRQSSSKDNILSEQPKENIKHEVSIEPGRKQSVPKEEKISTEIEPERKMSIIEIEKKLSLAEQERKQSLIKEAKLVEQRKQSLVKEEKVVQEPVLKDEKVAKKVKDIVDVRTNLTDAQKLVPIKVTKTEPVVHEELDAEWQYTLPSPPTAFRDSSPTNFTDVTNYDTVTFNGLTSDSVVSNPALFEKLESIRDTRSETETIVSEVDSSTSSKQEEVLTSKYLNLENLEKRKSLVLEREIASLKIAQNRGNTNSKNNVIDDSVKSQRESLRNEIEEAIQQKSKSTTLSRTNSQSREKLLLSATDSTLPNFKITTYDQPKSKINIYEDDTIRSNVENMSANTSKRNSIIDLNKNSVDTDDFPYEKKRNSLVSASTENMFFTKRYSVDDFLFKKPQEYTKYKRQASVTNLNDTLNGYKSGDNVSRSESFSLKNNFWSRSNPVKRSKSHISLDKYKDETKKSVESSEEGLHKSNSLFNVSGLQSLEVMRMILPKLGNTPPSTPPEDPKPEPPKLTPQKFEPVKMSPPRPEPAKIVSPKSETSFVPSKSEPVEKETVTKKYQYSGPPAINLGTWTERPKSQVAIKEDQDYKINNIGAMKSIFNSQTNVNTFSEAKKTQESLQQSYPSVNIRVNSSESKDQVDSGKINIKINSEPSKTISHQSSGNVIIKIGTNESSNDTDNTQVKPGNKLRENSFYSRFLNQTTAVGYRKPLGNINGVDKPRPHSIAFDANCPDLSRVPIVRAVELKKTFTETQSNKSVTQITHDNSTDSKDSPTKNGSTENHNSSPVKSNTLRHSSVYLSSENLNKIDQNGQSKVFSLFSKPITRGNSFASTRNSATPVVKGFRVPANKETEIDTKQYGTLPNKSNFRNVETNVQNFVPFSQSTLKRTENSVIARQQQPEKNIFENVVLRKTASNGLPSNRHSMGPVMEANGSFAPPPPPQMPKITAVTKKSFQRQLQVEDPRDQLLESIRSFGGKSGLRAVK